MKGSHAMSALLIFAALFGVALWYTQNYAYYSESSPRDFAIRLTPRDGSAPVALPARDTRLLTGTSSPLKFRACFKLDQGAAGLARRFAPYRRATPLKAPSWFDCFDYAQITRDLASGKAVALLGRRNIFDGVDRVVAIYGNGRAYAWNQFNEKYADQ